MNLAASTVPAPYLPMLIERLEAGGTPCRAIAEDMGVNLQRLLQPGMRMSRDLLRDVLRQIGQVSRRSDLGFEIGLINQLRADDPVIHLLLSAPTLGDSLQELPRWFALITPSYRLTASWSGRNLLLHATPSSPVPYDLGTMSLECIAVNLHRLMRFLANDRQFNCEMAMSWARPAHAHRYAELQGAQVRFDQGQVLGFVTTVPCSILATPMPLANDDAFQRAKQTCESQGRLWADACNWTDWVKAAIAATDGKQLTLDDMAALLNICGRTLARKLEEEGVTYRDVVQASRHERASALLQHSALTVGEIGHQLGYGDAANFGRAFRQIAGMPPGQYRAMFGRH